MENDVFELLHAREGHFEFESGHHGNLWLDLELLCLHPNRLKPFVSKIADSLAAYELDVICGPLHEGAFLALQVAEEMNLKFVYTVPTQVSSSNQLYNVAYDLPASLIPQVARHRTAIVNDVINAGSAVKGTMESLNEHKAETVAISCLLTLGTTPSQLAQSWGVDLISLATRHNQLWEPNSCPMCADKEPLN